MKNDLTTPTDSAEKIEEWNRKYRASEKGKSTEKKYHSSRKGKEAKRRYFNSEKGKAAQLRYYLSQKGTETRQRQSLFYHLSKQCNQFLEENPGKTIQDFLSQLHFRKGRLPYET